MSRLDPATWLPQAKALAVGQVKKVRHTCGRRESMAVGNEQGHWWAYCHRCRCGGRVDKTCASIGKPKVKSATGHIPTDVRPINVQDLLDLRGLADCLGYHQLSRFITLLKVSPSTGRVYFPDVGGFWYGLDYTGAANARWYSPLKVQACIGNIRQDTVQLVHTPAEYLDIYKGCILVPHNPSVQTINALLCLLLKAGVKEVQGDAELVKHFNILED